MYCCERNDLGVILFPISLRRPANPGWSRPSYLARFQRLRALLVGSVAEALSRTRLAAQPNCYVVEVSGVRVYISGDPINTFAEHDELTRPIVDLKPDIGLLTTHPTEGEFPFFAGSVKMANKLRLKAAVPSHYACFVQRTYDPRDWASQFRADGSKPIIIPYNEAIIYPSPSEGT